MRLIDADALIPMMKYATTDSDISVFPIKIGFDAIVKVINAQPTIEPRPKGRWLYASDSDGEHYYCSRCEGELPRYSLKAVTWDNPYPQMQSIDKTDYCPRCGADMRQRGGAG